MSLQERERIGNYGAVRQRLVNPKNAVADLGIDLKRKPEPPLAVEAEAPMAPLTEAEMMVALDPDAIPAFLPLFSEKHRKKPIASDIIRRVAKFYKVRVADMRSERRTDDIVLPRHIAMHLVKIMTGKSLPFIGKQFGDRDHTSVLHAVRKIKQMRALDGDLDDELVNLQASIEAEFA